MPGEPGSSTLNGYAGRFAEAAPVMAWQQMLQNIGQYAAGIWSVKLTTPEGRLQ